MIVGVAAPVVITDPADPRVADFRDLKAGDRPAGTPRGTGTVVVGGGPAGAEELPMHAPSMQWPFQPHAMPQPPLS